MRDLKDYLVTAKDGKPVNPGSPFNIKEDSAVIGNFTKENVAQLFAQHTEETGQQIGQDAIDYVWEQSKGQPWIVNSLFKRATMRILDYEDYQTVNVEHLRQAREQMILARETHIESLAFRVKDPHVRYVIEKLLTGEYASDLLNSDAFRQCLDLGLVANNDGEIGVANPVYREVLAREISYNDQMMRPKPTFRWQKQDGTLDMDSLLKEFQKFWRKHSEVWEAKSDYPEAFPHLLLMAFLQRITNGDGRIEREYAAGRGRMDLFIEYASSKYIIEVKLVHDYDTLKNVKEEGVEQILLYRDKFDKTIPCYLVIFDRRSEGKKLPWEERITWDVEGEVTVMGC
jgi:ASC-1-like (ASCH) protein